MNDLFEFLKDHPRLSSYVIYTRSTGDFISYRVFTEDDDMVFQGKTEFNRV